MRHCELPPPRPLPSRPILLLAEPPAVPDAVLEGEEIELAFTEAAVSLARAVFRRRGRIAVVGDETVAVLLATVAGDYAPARGAEDLPSLEREGGAGLVEFWMSPGQRPHAREERDREGRPDETQGPPLLDLLADLGRLRLREMPEAPGPSFFRYEVAPLAVVGIGATAGRFGRVRDFGEVVPPHRLYLFPSTGRRRPFRGEEDMPNARRLEGEIAAEIREAERELRRGERPEREDLRIPDIPPFALLMQLLVEEIAGDEDRLR